MLFKISGQLIVDDLVNQGTDIGVTQLCLGLAFELGIGQLDRDDGSDTFPAVLAGDLVVALDDAVFHAVGIENAGQRGLEACLVHAALGGADIIGEGLERLRVAVVVLDSDLGTCITFFPAHIDHILVDGGLMPIGPGDKLPNTALIVHGIGDRLLTPVIGNSDGKTRIQKCFFPHTVVKHIVRVNSVIKHLRVGLESDLGTGLFGVTHDGHRLGDIAPGKFHLVNFAVFVNSGSE